MPELPTENWRKALPDADTIGLGAVERSLAEHARLLGSYYKSLAECEPKMPDSLISDLVIEMDERLGEAAEDDREAI